jgi:hypothetical protein
VNRSVQCVGGIRENLNEPATISSLGLLPFFFISQAISSFKHLNLSTVRSQLFPVLR